jgi:hypothetical protein
MAARNVVGAIALLALIGVGIYLLAQIPWEFVSWRSWQAVTAMRPGREGFVKNFGKSAQGREEVGLT